ncbi:MAG: hypothetical protein ACRDS1_00330 [Pseudonocardiaceae bacterium]
MNTVTVIGLGILAWVLLSVPLALFVGRMIRLRDRQLPGQAEPGAPPEGKAADARESTRRPPRWRLRNKA